MATRTRVNVEDEIRDALAALAVGSAEVLENAVELRGLLRDDSGLDPRSFALVKIAALVAVDAPPASYLWQVQVALEAGATPRDIVGVLAAVAPQVGLPKVIAAAPEIMLALELELPGEVS
ncbi:MAG TPA: carboxymuconolactone decarboxylase family protein [Streptosporangiaceae bacterium]|jgi:alkylhydroperoxidase/carboxymuconolactone decarboxylase family protein YurZ